MQIALRDRLAFPAGIAPGFDPAHRASKGLSGAHGLSAVAVGGNMVNLLNGSPGVVTGAPTAIIHNSAGPCVKFNGTSHLSFPIAAITDQQQTIAGIFVADGVASQAFFQSGSNTNGGIAIGVDGAGNIFAYAVNPPGNASSSPSIFMDNAGIAYFFAVSANSLGTNFVVVPLNGTTFLPGSVIKATGPSVGTIGAPGTSALIGTQAFGGSFAGSFAAAMFSPTYLSMPELVAWAEDPWSFWYPNYFDLGQQLKGGTAANTNASISGAGCSALAGSLASRDSFVIGGAQAAAQAGSVSVSTASSTSVNISGAQATAQAGSVKPAISVPLAGAGASAQAGSISATDAIGVTGAAVTAAAGALAPRISVALSGAQAAAQAGTVSFSGSINAPITGAQVAASAGSVAETETVALSGAAATAQAGQVSFSNAINVPLTGAQANSGAGSLAPAITSKALIGAAAIAQAGAVFSSINLAPLGAAAIGQAGILAETARFSLLGAAAAALAGQVTVSIGAAVLLASARLVRVAGESRTVRLSADARVVTPRAS